MAHISILTSLFYGALSGSAAATVAAVGGIMIPAMEKEGYPKEFATAVNSTSGLSRHHDPAEHPAHPFRLHRRRFHQRPLRGHHRSRHPHGLRPHAGELRHLRAQEVRQNRGPCQIRGNAEGPVRSQVGHHGARHRPRRHLRRHHHPHRSRRHRRGLRPVRGSVHHPFHDKEAVLRDHQELRTHQRRHPSSWWPPPRHSARS